MPTDRLPRRPLSLALRITAVVGVALSVVFVTFTVQIARSIEQHFVEMDLGELNAVAESLATALGPEPSAENQQALRGRLARAVAGHHGVYFSVHDAGGATLFGTTPAGLYDAARSTPASAQLDKKALRVWAVQDRSFRGAVLHMRGETVLVAVAIDAHLSYLAQLRRGLWWGTVVACAISVLAAWLAVRWGHAPLRTISTTVRSITSEQLHVRLKPAEVPIELDPLVTSFNAMLDQLQASFKRLTHFTADIAHELRTPVTNLTTQTQVALAKVRQPEAYREVLYSSLEELDRMGKMIGDMLFLAQADHHLSKPDMAEVDLVSEVRTLFDYFEAWAEDVEVALELKGSAPLVHGDRLMLRRALSNLISNALRYTPKGQALTVRLTHQEDWVEIAVENPGPDIPAEHLPRLFDRFYRVDPARQHKGEGAGLGLAIVKSIVEAHGGSVRAHNAVGVICFVIRLPD
jgi:two-component system heavy metal sensor histidine kinase CusS